MTRGHTGSQKIHECMGDRWKMVYNSLMKTWQQAI